MISVVLPTKDEEKNILILLEDIVNRLKGETFEVIVIDAQSKDCTVENALGYKSKGYPVRVFVSKYKKGLAYETYLAMQYAKYPLIAVMDTDLQHDPQYLLQLIEYMSNHENIEMVIGSRYAEGGSVGDWNFMRKIISLISIAITKFITGVNDPITQYYVVRKELVDRMYLEPEGMRLSLYLIARLSKFHEIPIQFRSRIHGETTQTFGRFLTDVKFVLTLLAIRLRSLFGLGTSEFKDEKVIDLSEAIEQ